MSSDPRDLKSGSRSNLSDPMSRMKSNSPSKPVGHIRRTSVEDGIEQGEGSPHESGGEDVGAWLEEARAAVLVEDLPALHSEAQARRRGQKTAREVCREVSHACSLVG